LIWMHWYRSPSSPSLPSLLGKPRLLADLMQEPPRHVSPIPRRIHNPPQASPPIRPRFLAPSIIANRCFSLAISSVRTIACVKSSIFSLLVGCDAFLPPGGMFRKRSSIKSSQHVRYRARILGQDAQISSCLAFTDIPV
jgi:hypothetical protein